MPIQRRIPKIGFKNNDRVEYKVFNLGQIETLVEKYALASFSMENLYVNGLVSRTDKVKILGNGAISTKIDFKVNAISEKAKSVIEAAGGSVEIIK
jgi:large subunit ribosomal protein L15